MNKNVQLKKLDILLICSLAIFFLSCIATTYHCAETLHPGEVSLSPGYMHLRSIEDFSESSVQLLGTSARIGASNRLDFGVEHVLDITKDSENSMGSVWGDFKVQLTNKKKLIGKPILSTGLIKGYTYDNDARIHLTSLPIMLSLKPTSRFIPTVQYRLELISDEFAPTSMEDPRHTFAFGIEYSLREPSPDTWDTKLSFSLGTMNSLMGISEDPSLLFVNFGMKFNTPYKIK